MPLNTGYLKSNRKADGDEAYTPFYAVTPLLKYLDKNLTIWCPFDQEWSAYVQLLRENNYNVIATQTDFFKTETPKGVDVLISNPPFSKKDEILTECVKRNLPFILLLPIQTLQGLGRYKNTFSKLDSIQALIFDKRIGFHNVNNFETPSSGNAFASIYIIGNIKILPNDLIIEELKVFDRKLK